MNIINDFDLYDEIVNSVICSKMYYFYSDR